MKFFLHFETGKRTVLGGGGSPVPALAPVYAQSSLV